MSQIIRGVAMQCVPAGNARFPAGTHSTVRGPCKIGSNRILAAVHPHTRLLFVCPVPAAPLFGAGQFALSLSVTAAGTLP